MIPLRTCYWEWDVRAKNSRGCWVGMCTVASARGSFKPRKWKKSGVSIDRGPRTEQVQEEEEEPTREAKKKVGEPRTTASTKMPGKSVSKEEASEERAGEVGPRRSLCL